MTLNAPYDPDNIFARILRGEIPSVKVWEDVHEGEDVIVLPDLHRGDLAAQDPGEDVVRVVGGVEGHGALRLVGRG